MNLPKKIKINKKARQNCSGTSKGNESKSLIQFTQRFLWKNNNLAVSKGTIAAENSKIQQQKYGTRIKLANTEAIRLNIAQDYISTVRNTSLHHS